MRMTRLSSLFQSLRKVCDYIINVLYAHRQAHGRLGDMLFGQLLG